MVVGPGISRRAPLARTVQWGKNSLDKIIQKSKVKPHAVKKVISELFYFD